MKIETLLKHRVVAVIRHATPENIVLAASALIEGGIHAIEITVENPGGIQAIKTLANSGLDVCLGAGTVMDGLMADLAIQAGAGFLRMNIACPYATVQDGIKRFKQALI